MKMKLCCWWGQSSVCRSVASPAFCSRPQRKTQTPNRAMPIGWGLTENRQGTGLRREETRVEKTYIGQRAHSAIQYQKPSFNTYYSCPFSQSRNLKPSSLRKPSVGGGGGGGGVWGGLWQALLFPISTEVYHRPMCLFSSPRAPRKNTHACGLLGLTFQSYRDGSACEKCFPLTEKTLFSPYAHVIARWKKKKKIHILGCFEKGCSHTKHKFQRQLGQLWPQLLQT